MTLKGYRYREHILKNHGGSSWLFPTLRLKSLFSSFKDHSYKSMVFESLHVFRLKLQFVLPDEIGATGSYQISSPKNNELSFSLDTSTYLNYCSLLFGSNIASSMFQRIIYCIRFTVQHSGTTTLVHGQHFAVNFF